MGNNRAIALAVAPNSTISTTTVFTEIAVGPGVQIMNRTFNVKSGVPVSIVFNVTSSQPGRVDWAIATGKGQLAFLTPGLIRAGEVPLPDGVSVRYPNGTSFAGNQTEKVSAILTIAGAAASQGSVSLKLAVFQELPAYPGQSAGVVQSFVVTVEGTSQSTGYTPGLIGAVAVIGAASVGIVTLLVVSRRRRGPVSSPAEAQ